MDDEILHGLLAGLGAEDILPGGPGLGGVEGADFLHTVDIIGVKVAHGFLIPPGGQEFLQAADAGALF